MIKDNLIRVRSEIAKACQKCARNPEEITLIGVTKTAEVDKIKEALQAGLTDIAENRVQEVQRKFPELSLSGRSFKKHLIGHLQTNKVKYVVPLVDLIHSVDSLHLAQEIEKQAVKFGKVVDILIQIKTSDEESKFGADEKEALKLISDIHTLAHVRILGLMTMAPYTENKDIVRDCFKRLRLLRDQVTEKFSTQERIEMKYLSMGMSDDFDIAIEEGSNMVRVGRAIFNS